MKVPKLSFHARQRLEERHSSESISLLKNKLARSSCIDLQKKSPNGDRVSLVEMSEKDGLVAVWNKKNNIVKTVITVPQYLERSDYIVGDKKNQARLTKYTGVSRDASEGLKWKLVDLKV